MSSTRLSDCFKYNYFLWRNFGLLPSRCKSSYYKYYTAVFFILIILIYNIFSVLNLIYTPRQLDLLIHEAMFLFTDVAMSTKYLVVLLMARQIAEILKLLNCEAFQCDQEVTKKFVKMSFQNYKSYFIIFALICNMGYVYYVFMPILLHIFLNKNLELPICNYYFLSNESKKTYFLYIFIFQSFGMYCHMMCNVSIDTFFSGLLIMAITQLKILNYKLKNLKLTKCDQQQPLKGQEYFQIVRLKLCLEQYDIILMYSEKIQRIVNLAMFVQFCMASVVICVNLCGLLLISNTETRAFLVFYVFAMILQIFVPCWLGTQLKFESQGLVFASYDSEWIPRSEDFKRSLKIFRERANTPIVLYGWKFFPLSLETFTSIMKTAYSLFTLVLNVQDR